jgi:L-serine kinase (ADP)
LDEDPSDNGFEIKDSLIPILISLRPIESLRPHEETVGQELGLIINDLEHENVLRHPLIADRSSGVVLDGTHRLAALKALKCRWVPCALVKYEDPKILVDRWYRVITGSNVQAFVNRLELETSSVNTDADGEKCLQKRQCYASIDGGGICQVFPCRDMTPLELTRAAFKLEQAAKDQGLKVKYADKKGASSANRRFVLSSVKLEKREIVESALAGAVFPPKTTRHVIPSRPLGTSTPIDLLRTEQEVEAQSRFIQDLKSKRVNRLPEGSKVGSRRYVEEVFVFS